jgi:ubiquinone/menaquinone biosynthesis C-methylase UbiE
MDDHISLVQQEFSKQSSAFNDYQEIFSKSSYMKYIVDQLPLTKKEKALECAAGTCAFGRMIAPKVAHLTELDATDAMLKIGIEESKKENIQNTDFLIGLVEKIPFDAETFDFVFSRLAYHHFADPEEDMKEMSRVLKKNGYYLIVDMEARDEKWRDRADQIERARDPSHVRCLSEEEITDLMEDSYLEPVWTKKAKIPVSIDQWMNVTDTPPRMRKRITQAFEDDLAGKEKTGMDPYRKDGQIFYDQTWISILAKKKE